MGRPTQGVGIAVRDPEKVNGHCSNGVWSATSETLIIWTSGIWVTYRLPHAQVSHHLGQRGIVTPFTSGMLGLSHVHPQGADGGVNPFHEGVHWVRRPLREPPSILQPLSRRGVNGDRRQPFCPIPRTQDTVHLCPNVSRAILPRVPLSFAEMVYLSRPTPPEYMVSML